MLTKLRHYVRQSVVSALYHNFIQPHVDYSLMNRGCPITTGLNSIRVDFDKALKIMSFKEKYLDTTKKYENAGRFFL